MFKGELKKFIDTSLKETQIKQTKFIDNYKIKPSFKYVLNENGICHAYFRKKLIFKARYEILGTYNKNTGFFRHSWSNKNIKKSLSKISNEIKNLNYQTFMFDQSILEGHGWGKIITSIAVNLKKRSLGYLVKNDHDEYPETYIIIKSIIKH